MNEADRIQAELDRMYAERARRRKRRQRREGGLVALFRLPYVVFVTIALIVIFHG